MFRHENGSMKRYCQTLARVLLSELVQFHLQSRSELQYMRNGIDSALSDLQFATKGETGMNAMSIVYQIMEYLLSICFCLAP